MNELFQEKKHFNNFRDNELEIETLFVKLETHGSFHRR